MLRAVTAIAGTVAGLVLLLSFKTHSTPALATPAAAVSKATAPSTATTSSTTTTTASSSSSARTVAGDVEDTRYGPVQVQVTVRAGRVTAVQALQYPSGDGRSQQINAYAIPILNEEALRAGSAHISMISGATYTSDGYVASLQSALTRAGL